MLCEQSIGDAIMLICDWCLKGWHMGSILFHHWKTCWSKNDSTLGALSRPRYLFL